MPSQGQTLGVRRRSDLVALVDEEALAVEPAEDGTHAAPLQPR